MYFESTYTFIETELMFWPTASHIVAPIRARIAVIAPQTCVRDRANIGTIIPDHTLGLAGFVAGPRAKVNAAARFIFKWVMR